MGFSMYGQPDVVVQAGNVQESRYKVKKSGWAEWQSRAPVSASRLYTSAESGKTRRDVSCATAYHAFGLTFNRADGKLKLLILPLREVYL